MLMMPVDEESAEHPRGQVGLGEPALGAGRQDDRHRPAGGKQEGDERRWPMWVADRSRQKPGRRCGGGTFEGHG